MRANRRLLSLAVAVASALAMANCAARSTVRAYLNTDIGPYARYSWAPPEKLATGDPRLDNNEIFQARVQAAVDRQLTAKGFEKATSGMPDLLVHFHVSVSEQIDLNDTEPLGICQDPSQSPSGLCEGDKPFIYDAGTLVVDLVDARTSEVVWRGWSEGNISGLVDSQQALNQRIDGDVERMFVEFPRRSR